MQKYLFRLGVGNMGKLIVIDGLDGSGKATQVGRLYSYLKDLGKNVYRASFPQYDSGSSKAVRMYLNGELGKDPYTLNPYMCSGFYAIDRAIQFVQTLHDWYVQEDSIILCDRYISANIIYQASKLDTEEERKKLFDWLYDTEVNKFGIPHEDITIVLSVPVEVSQKLMTQRYANDESKKDIHESNIKFLQDCYNNMKLAVEYLPTQGHNWVELECSDGNGGIKSLEEIENSILEVLKPILNL